MYLIPKGKITMKHELWEIEVTWNALVSFALPFPFFSLPLFLLTLWASVEYDFRKQERRFKELFQSLCPPSPERREGYEESLSLLTLLIHNHKLHQLNANIMTQSQSESQTQSHPQIISQIQCQIQAQSQIQTHSPSQIQSRPQAQPQVISLIQPHSQIQIQPQIISQIQSQTEIMPQIQSQAHPENQCLFKAKIKRKKLCRKLFGWLPHKVQTKWLHHAKNLIFMHDSQPSGMRSQLLLVECNLKSDIFYGMEQYFMAFCDCELSRILNHETSFPWQMLLHKIYFKNVF